MAQTFSAELLKYAQKRVDDAEVQLVGSDGLLRLDLAKFAIFALGFRFFFLAPRN